MPSTVSRFQMPAHFRLSVSVSSVLDYYRAQNPLGHGVATVFVFVLLLALVVGCVVVSSFAVRDEEMIVMCLSHCQIYTPRQ